MVEGERLETEFEQSGTIVDVYQIPATELTCRRTQGGRLEVFLSGVLHSGVQVSQAFPRSDPGRYLVLADSDQRELGMVVDLAQLDSGSQDALAKEIRLHYIMPVLMRVESIRQQAGSWSFRLNTDRGPMRFVIRNLHEHVEGVGTDRMILTAADGRSCEIASIRALDARSQRELAKII